MNIIKSLIFLNILLISFSVSASSWITKKGENFDKDSSCDKSLSISELNKKVIILLIMKNMKKHLVAR